MHPHRFSQHPKYGPVSTAAENTPVCGAFMVCPPVLMPAGMAQAAPWLAVYQRAYECAQAVVRPSRLERLEAASWN